MKRRRTTAENTAEILQYDEKLREIERKRNKIAGGDHTGICKYCGSSDLWDDNLAYGCKKCGRQLGTN